MDVVRICMIGIAGVLLATFLKKEKNEKSLLISMLVCMVVFGFLISKMQIVLAFVERLENMLSIDSSYIVLILKIIGIAFNLKVKEK